MQDKPCCLFWHTANTHKKQSTQDPKANKVIFPNPSKPIYQTNYPSIISELQPVCLPGNLAFMRKKQRHTLRASCFQCQNTETVIYSHTALYVDINSIQKLSLAQPSTATSTNQVFKIRLDSNDAHLPVYCNNRPLHIHCYFQWLPFIYFWKQALL